jgi:hypothetical protein
VAKVIVSAMNVQSIPNKVTFECISTKEQQRCPFEWPLVDLKEDGEESIVKADHFKATRIVRSIVAGLFIIMAAIFLGPMTVKWIGYQK